MTRRTPTQDLRLNRIAETESQRQLARSVSCDDCGARIDRPCITRHGRELRAEHPRRLRRAVRMRDAGEVQCSFCRREHLTPEERGSTPWPAELEWCAGHLRIAQEIEEARAMEPMTVGRWDGHRDRLYRGQIDKGRDEKAARARAGEQAAALFGPRPEEAA
jgi:hypothetical protein